MARMTHSAGNMAGAGGLFSLHPRQALTHALLFVRLGGHVILAMVTERGIAFLLTVANSLLLRSLLFSSLLRLTLLPPSPLAIAGATRQSSQIILK